MKRLVHQPTTPGQEIVCGVEPNVKVKLLFGYFSSPIGFCRRLCGRPKALKMVKCF